MAKNPTTDERRARIARDGGDGAELVYLTAAGRANRSRAAYHDDPTCEHLVPAETRQSRRDEAQGRGDYPCKRCVLGEAASKDNGDGRGWEIQRRVREVANAE